MLWLRVVVIVSLIALNTLVHVPPLVLLALVMVLLTVAYFGLLGWLIYTLGDQAWAWFRR